MRFWDATDIADGLFVGLESAIQSIEKIPLPVPNWCQRKVVVWVG